MLGHRVLDRLSLADEIEHHHRVREQRDQRREDAVRDVTRDVGAAQTEDRGRHETDQAEEDAGQERLSHENVLNYVTFAVHRRMDRADRARARRGSLRALDVAMGRGRHALVLARAGFRTFGVDISLDAVRAAMDRGTGAKACASTAGAPI